MPFECAFVAEPLSLLIHVDEPRRRHKVRNYPNTRYLVCECCRNCIHVPELRSYLTGHSYSISGVPGIPECFEEWHREIVFLHILIILKAAAGTDDSSLRPNCNFSFLRSSGDNYATDPPLVNNELHCARIHGDSDAPLPLPHRPL